ncbi:MAG TPA: hypothetical protein VF288_08700 [Mycobacteriales bacterium]
MSWSWRCESESGEVLAPEGGDEQFPTQSDAESWVGEMWQDLRDRGVAHVVLLHDGAVVYGPMSLSAAE